jgi:hypothetical protein
MSKPLEPKHELVIWKLLITGDDLTFSQVKPDVRKPLLEQGLIRIEKRGSTNYISLEDKAWDWVAERMRSPAFTVKFNPRATTAIPILEALLTKLGGYLRSQNIALADLLAPSTEPASPTTQSSQPDPSPLNLEQQIRQAYADIAQTSQNTRVRIAQLHQKLRPIPGHEINQMLRTMQQNGNTSLRPMEDPQEITPADEAAAIHLSNGDTRYFVYI